MQPVEITRGECPIVLAMPHSGTYIPDDIGGRLNEHGKKLKDTDWHIDQLYLSLIHI